MAATSTHFIYIGIFIVLVALEFFYRDPFFTLSLDITKWSQARSAPWIDNIMVTL